MNRRNAVSKRIQRDLKLMMADPPINCSAGVVADDNIYHWHGTIIGPVGTPYEGGVFQIDIRFPDDYPFKPPQIRFITPIYHPNIHIPSGSICLDILKDKWSPALSMQKVLLSLCSLLSDPNPDDPLSPDVARQMKQDIDVFLKKARMWTNAHA